MNTKRYQSYEEAAIEYLAQFNALLQIQEEAKGPVDRTAIEKTFIEHADKIADISAGMIPLAKEYLESPDMKRREGISMRLLTEAAAELQVAANLMEIVYEEEKTKSTSEVQRFAQTANLRETIDILENSMKYQVSMGISPYVKDKKLKGDISDAKNELEKLATKSTESISQKASDLGHDVLLNLISNNSWSIVINSAKLVRKDISDTLKKISHGSGVLVAKALRGAAKIILNVYDKIMAILGKDAESEIREKIQAWLEDIESQGNIDLFNKLIGKLYSLDSFQSELSKWLTQTQAKEETIIKTGEDVEIVAEKFEKLVQNMRYLETGIEVAKKIKVPKLLGILMAIQISLIGVVVYSGYDYIGYKQAPQGHLNLTKGVAETIKDNLF